MNKHKVDAWAEAKRLCRLSAEDMAKAKALGMSPKSLIKNIPSRSQQWKAPVREWVRDLYEKRFGDSPVRTPPIAKPAPASRPAPDSTSPADDLPPLERDSDEDLVAERSFSDEDRDILRKRRDWIQAAKYVTWEVRKLPWVERVALFGSLAGAPTDLPSSGRPKLWPGATLHDPKDIDLAVWVTDLTNLRGLQKARVRGLQRLLEKSNVGVAHHQVDVFLLEPGTNRYLGRLCHFKTCPLEGKLECRVPGCGASRFLQQHEGFVLAAGAVASEKIKTLFDRRSGELGSTKAPTGTAD